MTLSNDECYVVEVWDFYFNQWIVYSEFLDCADAEKRVSYLLECNKRNGTRSKYRIIKKTIKQEIVFMKQETIDDILCEMRKDIPRVVDAKVILRNYADRIEAAHKREVSVSKMETTTKEFLGVGNGAKMRKALAEIRLLLVRVPLSIKAAVACGIIAAKAKFALGAKARNCDLYNTKDEAREAFQKLRGHRVLADVSLWDDRDEIEEMFDWLFAEAKGEAK